MGIICQLQKRALGRDSTVLHNDDPITKMKIIYCMCYQYARFILA